MLDSNFNLGDFGLAKLVGHEKGPQTTLLAGSLGYMAPECVLTGKISFFFEKEVFREIQFLAFDWIRCRANKYLQVSSKY
ncbi:LOW QUALITY PROTEIN: hypothetical protein OSB04_016152 [Centaurea solstitialis]|uniref:Protein kinase domain-containing protein n=1 Tax=Centaurea solstitialis TaxID=347529 RepID=A0AA38W9J5_9ASTR|nr:LOW QUALITY PROTEIN: hypothetical protein OSB04_016152 [Centaurea solstitialis]